jgi:hypothetical protein
MSKFADERIKNDNGWCGLTTFFSGTGSTLFQNDTLGDQETSHAPFRVTFPRFTFRIADTTMIPWYAR